MGLNKKERKKLKNWKDSKVYFPKMGMFGKVIKKDKREE